MSCDFWSLENASATTSSRAAADASEALTYLQRGREIIGAVESWLGIAGMVERAEAVVAAAQGKYAPAEDQFKKAIATFQHYCLPWEEADTLQYWAAPSSQLASPPAPSKSSTLRSKSTARTEPAPGLSNT